LNRAVLSIQYGLIEAHDQSGVLLLVSESENRAKILADVGIHRVVEMLWEYKTGIDR